MSSVIYAGVYLCRDSRHSVFSALTKAGLACATVDYRLLREARWPAQSDDIAAAISFIRAGAGEYGIDATRIGTLG